MSIMSLSRLPNPLAQTTDLWVSLVRGQGGNTRKDGSVAESRPVSVGRKVSSEGKASHA